MSRKLKRFLSSLLALMMVFSLISYTPREVQAATASDYGLMDSVADGVILHAWNWSFTNIKNNMKDIAEAGYTAVQTSPVQRPKDSSMSSDNTGWWKVYQPTSLCFSPGGHPWFGTKDDFKAMCDEAEKYGVKVIVDIVANHMANVTGKKGNTRSDISSQNEETYRDDDSCWHLNGSTGIDYVRNYRGDSTDSLTRGFGGWPDLNTGSSKVQQGVLSLLKECIDLGADGFRFDAAKHIELPTDPDGSDFWPVVINGAKNYASSKGIDLYCYGEILDNSGTAISNYTKYMAVTDNRAGNDTRENVKNGNASGAASSYLYYSGEKADNIVLWAESHDTYANDNFTGPSVSSSQDVINRTWAIVASRDFAALYYIRPSDVRATMGAASGNTSWKNKEVAEVNKFHNYFSGTSEYLGYDGNVVYNVRNKAGVVLVNVPGGSASVNFSISKTGMADGTYTDQVTGNKFTVSGGNISGQIGNTGIAVVYNAKTTPTPTISQQGGSFSSDTLTLTLGLKNATKGTYKIGSASAQDYTGTKTITIGSDMSYGDSVTITLTATDGSTTSAPVSYTFTKTEQTGNVAYLKLPSGWGTTVYCYAYDSATEKISNGTWPGVQMTLDSSTGYYKYEIPENIVAPRVIFYNSDSNRYPADMEKGLLFETDGSWLYDGSSWKQYSAPVTKGTVIVKYVDESGNEVASSKTLTGNIGSAYTTSAASVSGYTLKTTPSNATGTYTSSAITVTYVYKKASTTDPTVTSSLADGSSFKTETQKITLTLENAVSGTYSVDNGPVKTFTNTASVVLGQGKVADSTVTVTATATGSDGTKNTFTFNYKKVFNGTVNEVGSASAKLYNAAAGSSLASQYKTNPIGTGKKANITIDGSFSDWSEDMLIAQGAAWDVANHWKGGHENCVLDTYALYAAWDDSNLYVAWQMVNTADTWARSGDGPLSDGGRVLDVPLILALSVDSSSVSMSNKNTSGGSIWGQKMGLEFDTHVDRLLYMSGKVGLGKPSMFKAVDANGNTDYEEGCIGFSEGGIEYAMAEGNIASSIIGLNNSNSPSDVFDSSADWVDYKTFSGSAGTHDTKYDSFYEIKIPFETLGITKTQLEDNGVGAMLVATRGESALDCIPFDASMVDNATGDYSSDPSTSLEKEDIDIVTASLAQIGGGDVPPPDEELELNFGADRSSPQSANTALTLKGIAEGGKAPYTYNFYVNGTSVGTKSGSGETSVSWTPSEGAYTIKCVVTDAAGTSVTSTKKYTIEGSSPIIKEGWKHDSKGWWYQNADGTYVKNAWKKINGKWYHFDANGYMQTGWYKEGTTYYYLKSNGAMAADEWVENDKYYIDANGKWVEEGWKHDSKGWWYQNADGTYPKNAWKKINGKWYHFDANGYMQTGWYKEGTTYYYLKSNGVMAADEWVENDKYYIDANGKWVEGKVKVEEGWKQDSKGWWYQNADGTYPKNAWKKINGKWYHFDANGYMQTGWYKEGSVWYYLKSNGVMAAGEWVENGKYYIDSNGHWVQ